MCEFPALGQPPAFVSPVTSRELKKEAGVPSLTFDSVCTAVPVILAAHRIPLTHVALWHMLPGLQKFKELRNTGLQTPSRR